MKNSLVDCGGNNGICRDDMRILEVSERFAGVSGLAGNTKQNQLSMLERDGPCRLDGKDG
jgi:hypothetical protein